MHTKIIFSALFLAVLVTACQPPPRPVPDQGKLSGGQLVWPQPPLQPRIRFVRAVALPADLGIQPSFFRRLAELIVGKEEQWLVRPTGVAVDGRVIYVADPGAQALWILDADAGRFEKIQEVGGASLGSPVAVAAGCNQRVYLADSYLEKVFVLNQDGQLTATIADTELERPSGVACDRARDRLYVADSLAQRIWIFNGDRRRLGAIGRRGKSDAEFNFPTHVAVDREGALYVTDSLNFRVQIFRADGSFAGQFGRHGDSSGDFARPKGVASDSEGHIYVAEALFDSVQIFDREGRYLLSFGDRGTAAGQFWLPGGIFIDGQDRIYVADAYNQRIQIFQYLKER